jgi:hypothetical protein
MKERIKWLIIGLALINQTFAQNQPTNISHSIRRATDIIVIDGVLDEESWQNANRGGGFFQSFPTDNTPAIDSTQFMLTYDDVALYVGVICYDYKAGDPITTTLRRDFSWSRNDNISFYIDPYNDKSNGFAFQVTPDNVQREGLVILGGQVQDDWDNKWYSAVTKGENVWYAEMAIPFKSFRYNNTSNWNIQLIRNNQKRNERTTWINVPQQFRSSDMAFTGPLFWDNAPPEAGSNLAFIPYVAGSTGKNFEEDLPSETSGDAGFDAKIGLSNSLNLDLTFNPDFSQVEVDRQVTNLQRFEISFPERRQFFLENQDLFAEGGFSSTRPFFSRRIGIQGSGSTRRNVPIIGGARLSGKIGSKWRLGALNMVTNDDLTEEEYSPGQNYAVAVLERQIFERSRISGIFVGRTNLGNAAVDSFYVAENRIFDVSGNELSPNDTLITLSEYNYVYGVDYNLATVNNRWEGDIYYHRSIDPDNPRGSYSHGQFLRYQTTKVNARIFARTVGEGFNAEVGFVPRTGYSSIGARLDLNYFTDGFIQRHGPSFGGSVLSDLSFNPLDEDISTNYEFQFLNTSSLEFNAGYQTVRLLRAFDPSGSDGERLPADETYRWFRYGIQYESDQRKNLVYSFSVFDGGFYNGERLNIEGGLTVRLPPILQVEMNAEYNRVDLPEPYSDSELILLGPRIDLTLSNAVFFTSFVQYNTQADNLGHNSRLQWRFKPVSDLFIVYTDNYLTNFDFSTRNRALVLKLTYWLNI